MTVKGVFFDLGGTLFSYRNVARTNIPILLKTAERMDSRADAKKIKQAYGRAAQDVSGQYADKIYYRHRDLFDDIYKRFCELLALDYNPEIHHWYRTTQHEALLGCLEIKPDCIDTLQFLRSRGLYLSIASNIDDDMLEPLVDRENLHHYFDDWTSSEAALSCKPDKRFFEVTLEKSGLTPHQVIFVGDSPEHDIVGARAAGMRTVLVVEQGIDPPLQAGRQAADPDHTIHSLSELREIV